MQTGNHYDVGIVGGGLAGLAAAIQLSSKGYSVVLFEKETYPYHKVCGEYISLESHGFLASLGIPFEQLSLPVIDTLHLTAPNGNLFTTALPLGGFGISRYLLDETLAKLAVKNGVHLLQQTKVDSITTTDDEYIIQFKEKTVAATVCFAAYGKRSNLDVKWKRRFVTQASSRLNNYVGVKYHIKTTWAENVIGLHNFKNGYCGISKIEAGKYCLCYMTTAANLKSHKNSIAAMEKAVLYKNPHLKKIFTESEILKQFPVTISQISFSGKSKTENDVLLLGDAAGMITPLCGNGMSMALHTASIAAVLADDFLQQRSSRKQMLDRYRHQWQKNFGTRLRTGRWLQWFFGGERLSNFFVSSFKTFPFLAKPLIRQTHGKPF